MMVGGNGVELGLVESYERRKGKGIGAWGGRKKKQKERKKRRWGWWGKRKICSSLHRAIKFLDKVTFENFSKPYCYF